MISYKKLFLMMEEREITKEKLKNEIENFIITRDWSTIWNLLYGIFM